MNDLNEWQKYVHARLDHLTNQVSMLQAREQLLLFERDRIVEQVTKLSATLEQGVETGTNSSNLILKMELINLPTHWIRSKKQSFGVSLRIVKCDGPSPFTNTDAHWTAVLVLRNSAGVLIRRKDSEPDVDRILEQPIVVNLEPAPDGSLQARFRDIRIHSVSRRYGGHFYIEPKLHSPSQYVHNVDSQRYQIAVSYTKQKDIVIDSCGPDDELGWIKGFGPIYAANLAKLGFKTARDLSQFPLPDDPVGEQQFQKLISQIRKPGGMAETDFATMIRKLKKKFQDGESSSSPNTTNDDQDDSSSEGTQ
jgi:hypothetical protein